MVFLSVKRSGESSSILPQDIPLLSLFDGDQGVCFESLPDQAMDLLGVVSLIHDIIDSFSGSVRLFEQISCQSSVMRRMAGDR